MRIYLVVLVTAACGHPQHVAPSAPEVAVEPPSADATIVKAVEVPCGELDLPPPAPSTCAPKTLATDAGVVARVWSVSCAASTPLLVDDGSVAFGLQPGSYILDDHLAITPLSRRLQAVAVAGTTRYEVLATDTAERLLRHDGRCERIPLPVADRNLAARRDGTLVMWGRDRTGALQLIERTPDGNWRTYPPLREEPGLHARVFEQDGRVVSGYQSSSGPEIGFYDATHHLRPIRRGAATGALQLLPGRTSADPPTALSRSGNAIDVDQPDRELGFRRIELASKPVSCPVADGRESRPSGDFVRHTTPALVRVDGGTPWLVYGEWRGRCDYHKTIGMRAAPTSPFLLAHPPPRPPEWIPTERVEATELVLVPVEADGFGRAVRAALPTRPLAEYGTVEPAVSRTRIRLLLGPLIVDVDPAQLEAAR